MRLEVEKTNDQSGRIHGFVHRRDNGEEIAKTSSDDPDDTFEVPITGTYIISVDPQRTSEGEIILRDLN